MRVRRRHYVIDTADLVIGGAATVPRVGDEIVDGGLAFAIVSEDGQPAFSYTTQSRARMRIRTAEAGVTS